VNPEAALEFIAIIEKHLVEVLAKQAIAHQALKEKFRLKMSELIHDKKTLLKQKAKAFA